MGPRHRFQGMNSASLCSLAGRYDNPIPPRFLAPLDFLKIPALVYVCLDPHSELRLHRKNTFRVFLVIAWKADRMFLRYISWIRNLFLVDIRKMKILLNKQELRHAGGLLVLFCFRTRRDIFDCIQLHVKRLHLNYYFSESSIKSNTGYTAAAACAGRHLEKKWRETVRGKMLTLHGSTSSLQFFVGSIHSIR
jgi:hypothetical protein